LGGYLNRRKIILLAFCITRKMQNKAGKQHSSSFELQTYKHDDGHLSQNKKNSVV
jgi:hypothetical protein